MADTVNFTGAVDRHLLKHAKVVAAKSDTSVNALFNAQLRHLVETFDDAESRHDANYPVLLNFSLGKVNDRSAMVALGIDADEDLFLLMAQTRLPMPRLPAGMVQALRRLAP